MKTFLQIAFTTSIVFFCAGQVLADTTPWDAPEQSRQNITRTGGENTHDTSSRAERERGESNQNQDNSSDDGAGTVLNVSLNNGDGEVVVEYNTNGNGGNADISVTINGQTVADTGNHEDRADNPAEDGADGADGANGSDTPDQETETGPSDSEDATGRGDDRERDLSHRDETTSDRRPSR